jgi:hypothetical protein
MQRAAAATRLTGSRGATKQMLTALAARLHAGITTEQVRYPLLEGGSGRRPQEKTRGP